MSIKFNRLLKAEEKACILFQEIENRKLIYPGKTEKELNLDVFNLAFELFGIKKYWHKRIIRAGKNTLLPYAHNPENLTLKENDILFLDFGPVFEEFEADFGRTYVVGSDTRKLKLKQDVEQAWGIGNQFYQENKNILTGAEFYHFTKELALKFGWEYGNEHCGHLVGNFPHEKILGEEKINYIHPLNFSKMCDLDVLGQDRYWIYEIHFVNFKEQIGGFFEQLLK